MEAHAAEAIVDRQARTEAMLAAFSNATGWRAVGGIEWSKGLGHGDC